MNLKKRVKRLEDAFLESRPARIGLVVNGCLFDPVDECFKEDFERDLTIEIDFEVPWLSTFARKYDGPIDDRVGYVHPKTKKRTSPLEKQRAFHRLTEMFKLFVGGSGAGKTCCGAKEAAFLALVNPATTGVVGAHVLKALKLFTLPALLEAIPACCLQKTRRGKKYIFRKIKFQTIDKAGFLRWDNAGYFELRLVNGSVIYAVTFDGKSKAYESILGGGIAWFWMDEGARSPEAVWDMLLTRHREPCFHPEGFVTTTPRGWNWLVDTFIETDLEDYDAIRASTRENHYNPRHYVRNMEVKLDTLLAQQEIEGEIVSTEGLVYGDFDPTYHETDPSKRSPFWDDTDVREGTSIEVYMDYGYRRPYYMLVLPRPDEDFIFAEGVLQNVDTEVIGDELATLPYQISTIYDDPAGDQYYTGKRQQLVKGYTDRDAIRSAFRARGKGSPNFRCISGSLRHRPTGIAIVRARLKDKTGKIHLRFHPRLRQGHKKGAIGAYRALLMYHYQEHKEGRRVSDEPVIDGFSDHPMDAKRFGLAYKYGFEAAVIH